MPVPVKYLRRQELVTRFYLVPVSGVVTNCLLERRFNAQIGVLSVVSGKNILRKFYLVLN